jgi:hypothetical protein
MYKNPCFEYLLVIPGFEDLGASLATAGSYRD